MVGVNYIPGNMSHFEQFLVDVFYVCGVMKIFKDHSIGSFFF